MTEHTEPEDAIAIIGMSCRFAPDLDSLEKFWEFLKTGRSTVSAMPEKRWRPYAESSPRATAIMRNTTLLGSFLDDIEGFDADFFGISPREADFLDPQQRFMLELTWEALADAGMAPLSLRGTDVGVFVAANSNDYGRRLLEDIPLTGAYAVNGTTYYGIANRVSYFLDLHGPSLAVDTACAGSLTAVHLAAQSLRDGETPLAVVGGLNIMATPALNVALEGSGALAPDGRSKAFDGDADGYGRGEGAGVLVLKRLADARRDGDPVQAVILGSGVFQDGRSEGMMAPNADAQEHMLRRVYERVGIAPSSVDYVEAHGTGTPTGDGKEIEALAKVFGPGRSASNPCLVGSVKPNIGHVEGGSGIAGVIKTVLAMRHRLLPPSLHATPTPEVDWDRSGLRLVAKRTPWKVGERPRRAGVSSYGVGGTIAHLILQEGPALDAPATEAGSARPKVYPLSAMSEAGLRALSASVTDWLIENPDASLPSLGHTLTHRRSHLAQRAAVVAGSAEELTQRLRDLAEGVIAPGTGWARCAPGQQNGVVWVFSGHGAQWSGMGRQLLAEDPVFAAAIDDLADVFRAELGWTPREALVAGGPWSAAHIQALTVAMQLGLVAVWRSRGLRPGAAIGHSVGEIAAAVAAGSLDPHDAVRFACRRAAALQRLEGLGRMAMASVPFEQARQMLDGRDDIEAAISASPHSTVISGDGPAIEALLPQWNAAGIQTRWINSDIAFHSRHVDTVLEEVETAARELVARPPVVPLYSTALSDPRAGDTRDSAYWATNLRQPVRFAEAIEAALEDGHRLFVEVSAHPVVTHSISETVHHLGIEDATVTGTLVRNADEVRTLLGNLAKLHCNGAAVDWSCDHPGGELLAVPAVAWQHRPYWIFPDAGSDAGLGGGHDPSRHSLLGGRMTVSGAPSRQVWQTYLDVASRPYPLYHGLVGVEVTPAASIINTFAEAAADASSASLSDIVLRTPLAVEPPRVVQIVREGLSLSLATQIASESTPDGDDEWLTHTTATVDVGAAPPSGWIDADALRARLAEGSPARVGEMFERMGVGGYAFPWEMVELRRDDQEQFAVLDIVPPPATEATSWAHVIDGALTISAVVVAPGDATTLWMSKSIERVAFRGRPPARVMVHSRRSPRSPLDTVDVWVSGMDGDVLCVCAGLRFAAVEHLGSAVLPRELVHEIAWRPLPAGERSGTADLSQVVFVGDAAVAGALAQRFEAAGVPCAHVADEPDAADGQIGLGLDLLRRAGAIVVVPSLTRPGETVERSAERAAWLLVRTVQRLIEIRADAASEVAPQRIWSLTRGVRDARDERSVAHGPVWGASRIVAGEHPELWGGAVDLPGVGDVDDETSAQLLSVLREAAGKEDVISLAPGGVEVARLTQIERSADGNPLQCSPAGTVLITGGLGSLGLEVARWLVDHGARRLLLTSRRGLPPRSEWGSVSEPSVLRQIEGVLALEALGVTVVALALDITDAAEVARKLAPGALGLPAIRGIVHAAGVVNDDLVDKVQLAGLRDVMAPKAAGAMVLHRLFPPGELEFFVMFSSSGQFARLSGQTSYAAANSFMDALAAHRNSGGHVETRSMGWTAWRGLGLASGIASTMLEANSRGLDAVSVAEALRAWSFGDRFQASYQAVLRVLPTPPNAPRLPMFRELTATDDTHTAAGPGFSVDFEALSDEDIRQRVSADVREQVAAELNLDPVDVEPKRPLVELGVDSVMTVALRIRLQRRYGLDLPPTILWAKPTVAALSEHVIDNLSP
ncbi:beta-ketoacyl synthase N-terminal-like domain-containing protein [Dactylosporangium sp. NPDC051484]|uniref:type I polyketide synthase n=1 Tax=Dactylosporangium sp. NPDC051484 TaxID=3154942 RepID=UPI00344F3B39